MKVKVKHIYHSGFTLETDDIMMVFDYYRGKIDLKDKRTLVFATHGHADHYTEDIFKWKGERDDVSYVLSSDIAHFSKSKDIHIMKPYENLKLEGVKVQSFGSTDQGLSLIVSYKDINIFFAGDLNWWHWPNDSLEEQKEEERQFKDEIAKIKRVNVDINLAFFPVDPRLGEGFSLGGEHIIEELEPKYLFPMHFGDKYDTSRNFINKMGDLDTHIVDIDEKYKEFDIEV